MRCLNSASDLTGEVACLVMLEEEEHEEENEKDGGDG